MLKSLLISSYHLGNMIILEHDRRPLSVVKMYKSGGFERRILAITQSTVRRSTPKVRPVRTCNFGVSSHRSCAVRTGLTMLNRLSVLRKD